MKIGKTQDKYLDLSVVPYQFSKQNYGFALKDDSHLMEEFNQRLLRIREGPEWQQALIAYLGE